MFCYYNESNYVIMINFLSEEINITLIFSIPEVQINEKFVVHCGKPTTEVIKKFFLTIDSLKDEERYHLSVCSHIL